MLSFKEYINEGKWDNAYEFRVVNFSAEKDFQDHISSRRKPLDKASFKKVVTEVLSRQFPNIVGLDGSRGLKIMKSSDKSSIKEGTIIYALVDYKEANVLDGSHVKWSYKASTKGKAVVSVEFDLVWINKPSF